MAKKATRDQKEQVKTLSYVDTLMTVLGDYPEPLLPTKMDINPFGFLITICKSLGIFDELILFLVKIIQYWLPIAELAIKGILLANIKEMVSCSSDPYIPDYLRKKINSTETNGISFSVMDLDYSNLLSVSPLDIGAEYSYLGLDKNYLVHLQVIQIQTSIIRVNKQSNTYKDEVKADNWIKKQEEKYTKKYEGNPHIKITTKSMVLEEGDVTEILDENGEVTGYKEEPTKYRYYGTIVVEEFFVNKDGDAAIKDVIHCDFLKSYSAFTDAQTGVERNCHKLKKEYKYELEHGAILTKEIKQINNFSVHELARAKDFNAFLWYLTHAINLSEPIKISLGSSDNEADWNINGEEKNVKWQELIPLALQKQQYGDYTYKDVEIDVKDEEGNPIKIPVGGPLGHFELSNNDIDKNVSLLGTSLILSHGTESALHDLCIKSTSDVYTIVPATSDNQSLNWYGDRQKYFDFIKYWASPAKEREKSPRQYYREVGICNIEFNSCLTTSPAYSTFTTDSIRFTILPKPLVHIPQWINATEWPWNAKSIRFDHFGRYDKKGKYSVFTTLVEERTTKKMIPYCHKGNNKEYPCYYELANKNNSGIGVYLHIPSKWSTGIKITNSVSSPNEDAISLAAPISSLYETYPHLTIYEFNYDYIMSQRLFDPRVLAGQIIEGLLNVRLGFGFNGALEHNVIEGSDRFTEVIKNILSADTYASSDCYSSFSNEKYDQMSQQAEIKKSKGFHFSGDERTVQVNVEEINKILSEYDNQDITQEGQVDVLNRAFTQASASITAATEDKESWDIKFNFIQEMIFELVKSLIRPILSPKIMMILLVNRQILGTEQEWRGNVFMNFQMIISSIIIEIVKQIKDMILSQLLEFVIGFLKPKFEELAALIIKEYTEQYRDQIAALIQACGFGWGKSASDPTKIDQVTYADIADIDPIEDVC